MKAIIAVMLLLGGTEDGFNKIALENSAKKTAEDAFEKGNYPLAIQKFNFLIDTLKSTDAKAILNLAHAHYRSGNFSDAAKHYQNAFLSSDRLVKSIAAQQLGVLSFNKDKDKEKALSYFKESLRANPENADARYNYELLKKLVNAKEDPKMNPNNKDKNPQNKDQQKDGNQNQNGQNPQNNGGDKRNENDKNTSGKESQNKDQNAGKGGKDDSGKEKNDQNAKNQKGDKGDKPENKENGNSPSEKENTENARNQKGDKSGNDDSKNKDTEKPLAEDTQAGGKGKKDPKNKEGEMLVANPEALAKMGLNEARAKMLLDAMKAGEIQYLQQTKREPAAKSKTKKKSDW